MKKVINAIYKGYVLKGAAKDVAKLVMNTWDDMEWDKEYWLRKVGLATYTPTKSMLGGLGLLCAGVCVGAAAALAFATKPGPVLRAEVKDKAMSFVNRGQQMVESATSARM